MLQSIGDKLKGTGEGGSKAHRWFWYLILGALAIVFMAWGPTAVVDFTFGQSSTAVQVNDEEISVNEINDLWQTQLPTLMDSYGGNLDDATRRTLQQDLVSATVRELAATQHARALGYNVSDEQIGRAFRSEEAFQVDGQFSILEAQLRLQSAGVSEQRYLADLRKRLLANQLLGAIGISDFFTPAEGKRLLALLDEERELRYALLDPQDYAGKEPVQPEAIQAYYDSHQDEFAIPESVRLAYAELALSDIAATVTVSEAEVMARYEQDKALYVQPETRNARHILIASDGPANDEASLVMAQDLYNQITGGADFAVLAKEHSDDKGSAAEGGSLGWAGRDVYVQAFADKLFSMQVGEVSEPVKTEFGYHIIKLEGIRPESGRSFEEMRGDLSITLRNEKAVAAFNSEQDRLQEMLENSGAGFDAIVKEFGLRRGEIETFERGAGGLPLGSDVSLNREVFSDPVLLQRRIGGPAQLSEDRITIFQVQEHRPASTQPLEQVREEIVATLIRERGAEAALQAAEAGLKELAAGKRFEQVAASLKAKAEPARFVARAAPDLPVELRDALFAAARATPANPVRQALKMEDGTVALFESTASRTGAELDIPQLVQLRTQRELERYTTRDLAAYVNSLVEDAKVKVNPQIFPE